MKFIISNIYGISGTAYYSQHMTTDIAKTMGYSEMAFFRYPCDSDSDSELSARLDGVMSRTEFGDVVVIQWPNWIDFKYTTELIRKHKNIPGVKVVLFVHDVMSVMFEQNTIYRNEEVDIFNSVDGLILPSESMYEYLKKDGLTNDCVVYQRMWDHPCNYALNTPEANNVIHFTGNVERFPFVNEWKYKIPLTVYAEKDSVSEEANVDCKGYMGDTELMLNLSKGGWGLCWSEDTEAQKERRYSTMNASYKLSTYLAAGIPVVANYDIQSADIIKKNKLGILVHSLDEAVEIINNTPDDVYKQYVDSVKNYNVLIKNGYYTRKVLTDIMIKLFEK